MSVSAAEVAGLLVGLPPLLLPRRPAAGGARAADEAAPGRAVMEE